MNIAAHTPAKYEGIYPPYVSINRQEDGIEITVRSPIKPGGASGDAAAITMDESTFRLLLVDAIKSIAHTQETLEIASRLIDEQSYADLRASGGIAPTP
jgi:hypothetical protein